MSNMRSDNLTKSMRDLTLSQAFEILLESMAGKMTVPYIQEKDGQRVS